ncbi:MAG TPA: hypothetical protein VJN50_01355 [Actinomycetota bacterium]|nr:hypothetical protein [Actinomycetota bacterium]
MSGYRQVLEDVRRRVTMPEPAMERTLRRRDRNARNERIAALAVGLTVGAIGIGGTLLAIRAGSVSHPASGADTAPASPQAGGSLGLVLPTLAIWAAIATLVASLVWSVRVRRGHGSTKRGAPPRRRKLGLEAAQATGGNDMDAKAKPDLRIPEVRVPEPRFEEGRARRVNGRLTLAVVALSLAVVGLGVALIAQANGETTPEAGPTAEGLAPPAVVESLDASIEAWNSFDEEALAGSYGEEAVFDDLIAGETSEGIDQIATKATRYEPAPWRIERTSEVVQNGDFAAYAFTYNGGHGIAVFELTDDLRVAHQWVMGV